MSRAPLLLLVIVVILTACSRDGLPVPVDAAVPLAEDASAACLPLGSPCAVPCCLRTACPIGECCRGTRCGEGVLPCGLSPTCVPD